MAEDPKPDPKPDPDPDPKAAPATNTPDPQAVIADLQRQLEEATGSVQTAFNATRDALRAANPNLPPTVFEADNLEALTANVEAHKATAAHIIANPPKTNVNPGGGDTRVVQVPDGLRGANRIQFALNNPGPGMTE